MTVLAYLPSPPQGVYQLGPFPLRMYAVCIITGIVVATLWTQRRWEARGGSREDVLDVALAAIPLGIIGARMYHVITDHQIYFGEEAGKTPLDALKIWEGGLGIWGGVLGGAFGAWLVCRAKGLSIARFGDAVAPALVLAQAIGRLGNWFNQELYGRPTDVPWGLEIYEQVDGVSTGVVEAVVHPTFLYELILNLLVCFLLVVVDRRVHPTGGRLFALYVAGYSGGRFIVELMRSDPANHILGLRVNTWVSGLAVICGLAYFFLTRNRTASEVSSGAADAPEVDKKTPDEEHGALSSPTESADQPH